MHFDTFKQKLAAYRETDFSKDYLLALRSENKDLAETLLLHRDLLENAEMEEPVYRRLYLHYVVNTDGPIPATDTEPAPLPFGEWAAEYAGLMGITLEPEFGRVQLRRGREEAQTLSWTSDGSSVEQIRDACRKINGYRYGGDKIIPSGLFAFDEQADTHSIGNALWLSDLSELAYHSGEYVAEQLKRWGFDEQAFRWIEDTRTDTQAFITARSNYVVLSFRGTTLSSWEDIKSDLNFRKIRTAGFPGKIHSGFYNAFTGANDRTKSQILAELGAIARSRPIFITGHSLGAALAQLAAYTLAAHTDHLIKGVYLFGSPKVGNKDYVEGYNKLLMDRTHLHINNKDIVSRVPPGFVFGYEQVGHPANHHVFNEKHVLSALKEVDDQPEIPLTYDDEGETRVTDELDAWIWGKGMHPEQIQSVITNSTGYLKGASPESAGFASAYSTPDSVQGGAINEHGINQYFFKFACALVEVKWKSQV